ncbi:MAG: membrane protein insertase YidC [Xanthomonadales bacterium]|nr:membrane protein insertase YidC [Xanthomonadales bacterium]
MRRLWLLLLLATALSPDALAQRQVETEQLRLAFDASGNLQSAFACFPACVGDKVRLQQFGDTGVVVLPGAGAAAWQLTEQAGEAELALRFESGNGAVRTWRIPRRGYRLELGLSGDGPLSLRSGESFRPRDAAGFGNWLEQSRYAVIHSGDVAQVGFDDTEAEPAPVDSWAGYRNRYWALVASPPARATVRLKTAEGQLDAELEFTGGGSGDWSFYLGPIEPNALKRADPSLSNLLYAALWFWLRWICFGMFYLLAGLQAVIPSWGLAVMAMSVAVNILMLPLSRIADRFQQQVNETEARLAPELNRIKKNFKGEEQAAKILALYKTERVHPLYSLKSMMGVAVVIPVFIGAFDMLAENIHLLNAGFLWIADLSRPDELFRMPFRLPFFGAEFNLLPFLMTGLSVVASALHRPLALDGELRNRQVRNMLLLAFAFFVLFYTFPAGMVLYWTTNNLISVIKSLWARR